MQFYVTNTVKLHKPHRKKNKKILFSDANVQCQEKWPKNTGKSATFSNGTILI